MSQAKRVALALTVIIASGAAVAASASAAQPEFIVSKENERITIRGSNITLQAKGTKKFVECKTYSSSEGNVEGKSGTKKLANIHLKFTGCEMEKQECTEATLGVGEIESEPLSGELGYLKNPAPGEAGYIGLDLAPSSGEKFLDNFTCGTCPGMGVSIRHSPISLLSEIASSSANKPITSSEYLFFYAKQTAGKQLWSSFAGGAQDILWIEINGGGVEEAGAETTLELRPSEEGSTLEVKGSQV
jgi:hypothetical protein